MSFVKLPMKIKKAEKSLDDLVGGNVVALKTSIELNKQEYYRNWNKYVPLPEYPGMPGRMAYDPSEICVRECVPKKSKSKSKGRAILLCNPDRCKRPTSNGNNLNTPNPYLAKHHCKLCENILGQNMMISEIGDYYLTPNGYPYHRHSSLLICKSQEREQDDIKERDIETWMKVSMLLNQTVFYNAVGAGSTITNHLHAQLVDPNELRFEDKSVPYPIFDKKIVRKEYIKKNIYRLRNYPVDAIIFSGKSAPEKAMQVVNELKKQNKACNILINKKEIYVIGRDKDKEYLESTEGKAGAYEMSGVAIMNNQTSFSNLDYTQFKKEISHASIRLDGIVKKL